MRLFFFFSPPLAQCRKLFLLPHYIILQHLWLMHLRFRLPLSRSGEKVNFGWLPDVIITYLRFWQNTDATRRGSGETSKGIMSVLVIAQCRWFIQSGPEFEQTVNELRLCFFCFFSLAEWHSLLPLYHLGPAVEINILKTAETNGLNSDQRKSLQPRWRKTRSSKSFSISIRGHQTVYFTASSAFEKHFHRRAQKSDSRRGSNWAWEYFKGATDSLFFILDSGFRRNSH